MGVCRQLLHGTLCMPTIFNGIVDPTEHAGRVLQRSALPRIASRQRQADDTRALIIGRNFGSEESVDQALLANKRDVLAAEPADLVATSPVSLHLGGDLQQKPDLVPSELVQRRTLRPRRLMDMISPVTSGQWIDADPIEQLRPANLDRRQIRDGSAFLMNGNDEHSPFPQIIE